MKKTLAILTLISLLFSACGGGREQLNLAERRLQSKVNDTLETLAQREFSIMPEAASRLGLTLDRAGFDYRGQLNDYSPAGFEQHRLARLDIYQALFDLPLPQEGSASRNNLDVLKAIYQETVDFERMGRGRVHLGYARPYALDQLSGVYLDGPEFLARQHALRTEDDAIAFLERLRTLPDAINGQTRRLQSDARQGLIPPVNILDLVGGNIIELRSLPVREIRLIRAYDGLLTGIVGVSPADRRAFVDDAVRIMETEVAPAYDALLTKIDALKARAPIDIGLSGQPNGREYYAALLRLHTGTERSPGDIFELGETQIARLSAVLTEELDAAGVAPAPTLGERLAALAADPAQSFDEDPAIAREQILASVELEIDRAKSELASVLRRPPSTPIAVRPVPVLRQANAAAGYYQVASVNGAPLGICHINLRDPSEWSRFSLPTLAFHESIPGHHLETSVLLEDSSAALLRRLVWMPGYGEGWALYAEDLADELGFYENRPFARIGYLQSLLFRSARLVVDVGIHDRGWSRDDAIDFLVSLTGQPRAMMATEVDRYTVWPGQSVSYMIGRDQIIRLRRRAQAVLGDRFDLADFHEVLLQGGPRPTRLMERDIDQWLQEALD